MIRFAICDDEVMAARLVLFALRDAFDKRGVVCTYDVYTDSRALAKKLDAGMFYDAILIDIDMPGLNGIEFVLQYKEKLTETVLTYVSGREDLVFDTFQAQPFRFVKKRLLEQEIPQLAAELLQEIQRRKKRKVTFRSGTTIVALRPEQIHYVESIKKTQIIHLDDREIELQSSLQKVMEQLQGYSFVQIHKSFFVNCRYIFSINRTELTLDNGKILPVGRAYVKQVQDAFQFYILNDAPKGVQAPAP